MEAAIPLALAVLAYGLAFASELGLATTDTKINLQVDPGRYLSAVASMWTSTGQLGDVQTGQQAGYLFPMGPFFAAGHAVGLSAWVVQRLWLGTLLALAAWGVVRLLDAMLGRPRGVAHVAAGLVTMLNPFVVTYANRTTVTLLAYAALPWMLLAVHRGLRDPRSLALARPVRALGHRFGSGDQRGGDSLGAARSSAAARVRAVFHGGRFRAGTLVARYARFRSRCCSRCGGSCRCTSRVRTASTS